jgi:hypothetical protein
MQDTTQRKRFSVIALLGLVTPFLGLPLVVAIVCAYQNAYGSLAKDLSDDIIGPLLFAIPVLGVLFSLLGILVTSRPRGLLRGYYIAFAGLIVNSLLLLFMLLVHI